MSREDSQRLAASFRTLSACTLCLMSYAAPDSLAVNIQTLFAYHLTHQFGPFSQQAYHTDKATAKEGDVIYVVSGDDAVGGGKDYFLEGLFKVHRRIEGSFALTDRHGRPAKFNFRLSMTPIRVPDAPIPLSVAPWYSRKEVKDYFASGQNFNPLPTGFKDRFDELLAGYGQSEADELAEDLEDLRRIVDATQRKVLAQARIGQGRFRADVTRLWGRGEVCTLTGIALPELLVASHIKPWRDSNDDERLDPANGLLLAAHADKLFDRHLMSFESTRGGLRCVIAPVALSAAHATQLKVDAIVDMTYLNPSAGRRVEQYMRGHMERFRAKVTAMRAIT